MKNSVLLLAFLIFSLPCLQAETEPNNDAANANLFVVNGGQNGTLLGADLNDWFLLSLPQGGILTLTINKIGNGNGIMYLRDADLPGFPEIKNVYLDFGNSPPDGIKIVLPLLPGDYYVQLNKLSSEIDSYTLTNTLALPLYPEDTEPNDTFTDAITLPVNGTVSGNIHYYAAGTGTDMEDWYKVEVPQGGTFRLAIHKNAGGNALLYFRDGEIAGQPEITNSYLDFFESPPGGLMWSYKVLAGTYYIQLANGVNPLDYQLVASLTPAAYGDDQEPNDSLMIAQDLLVGDSVGGTIGYYLPGIGADNWDWYSVNVPNKGLLSFNISKIGINSGNIRLRNGTDEIASQHMTFGDLNTSLSKLVPAGLHYIGVEKISGDFEYKIVANLLPAPIANFTKAQTDYRFTFENTTQGPATYLWDFGDGVTATTVNAYHEYTNPGNFDICLLATNGGGADTACQQIVLPGVARGIPNEGGNTGDLSVEVFGGGLDTFFVGKIMQGNTIIATSNRTSFAGKSSISVRFDLRSKPVGNYTFVIEKPSGPSYTVPGGFNIVAGTAPDPWASITGRHNILFNTWSTYTLNYGNRGNVDATGVPIWLSFSQNPGLDVEFVNTTIYEPDSNSPEPPGSLLYVELDSLFGQPSPVRLYPLLLPVIPGGTTHSVKIRVKTSGSLSIKTWAEKPWFQSPINEDKLNCMGEFFTSAPPELNLTDKVECTKIAFVFLLNDFLTEALHDDDFNELTAIKGMITQIRVAAHLCGVTSDEDREKIGEFFTNVLINKSLADVKTPAYTNVVVTEREADQCSTEFEPQNPQSTPVAAVSSFDPNEKSGPSGFGPENYRTGIRQFPYTIHFENLASATAPAHTVTVSDQLDTDLFDLSTFSFGHVHISDSTLYVPSGLREFVLDKTLGNLGVTARVHGSLNLQTGTVNWTFRSLDAVTLEESEDPFVGFLPPNVTYPEGQGSVSFFVDLKNAPQHGQQVKNRADIVFDANPVIITNEHLVTFDLVPPQSAVEPLQSTINTATFEVKWGGSDDGSGVQFYNVYYQQNNGDTALWLGRTTATSAMFTAEGGNHYRFYSIAVDNAGNAEALPANFDAETDVVTSSKDLANLGQRVKIFPNPVGELLTVQLTEPGDYLLRIYHPNGKQAQSVQLSGGVANTVNTAFLPEGLYFWQVSDTDFLKMGNGKLVVRR